MSGWWWRPLGVVVAVASLTACGNDSPRPLDLHDDSAPTDDDAADIGAGGDLDDLGDLGDGDLEELSDDAVAASIDVRADGCGPRVGFGTGAMFDDDLAVTAAHVVAGADVIEVTDAGGASSSAIVVSFDPDLDLAVLRTDTSVGTPITIRAAQARPGERGVVALPRWIGDELELRIPELTVTRTVNISTTDIYLDGDVDRPGFEIEATVDPGDSGALVVLPGGGAGIIWARSLRADTSAWAIDLPPTITSDETQRPDWTTPDDTGPCTR